MDLLVATTNAGKLREIQALLDGAPVRLHTLADFPDLEEPAETGATFAENACIKAAAYAAMTGLPVVAEDSGLEIDALGGEPGIHSARYPGATYADKFANLYERLAACPRPWTARFVCELAFVENGVTRFSARGTVEGEIAAAPRGQAGFGYDPIFLYPPYGKTLAEVDGERKLAIVHRGQAFRAFRAWLETRHQPGRAGRRLLSDDE